MAASEVPSVVHPWLGALRRHGKQELLGSIDIDPSVRPPRLNGGKDAEILVEIDVTDVDVALGAHLDRCADRLKIVMATLPSIRRYAVDHAPQHWIDYNAAQPGGPLVDRLFLDGLEVDRRLCVSVVFDFGDLDSLVVVTTRGVAQRCSCGPNAGCAQPCLPSAYAGPPRAIRLGS